MNNMKIKPPSFEDLAEMSGFDNAITVGKVDDSSGTATITNVTYNCSLEKCKICNEESFSKNLCISCNENKNFYKLMHAICPQPRK